MRRGGAAVESTVGNPDSELGHAITLWVEPIHYDEALIQHLIAAFRQCEALLVRMVAASPAHVYRPPHMCIVAALAVPVGLV